MDGDRIDDLIWQAWERLRGKIRGDPDELRRRLARRRLACMTRPPRAWCLAIRAQDKRINEATLAISPHDALYPRFNGGKHGRHEVVLDTLALRRFCRPVRIHPAGETLAEVAKKLGVNPGSLKLGRLKGLFRVSHFRAGSQRGAPTPILYCDRPLDPSIREFALADIAFGWTGEFMDKRIPDGIEQVVERVPAYIPRGRHFEASEEVNVEQAEARALPRRKRQLPPLPPPAPDNVWYKWKGEEYLGYDWRRPGAKERFEIIEARKARIRERAKQRRAENPPLPRAMGSLVFHGWRWLCPGCARTVNVLVYPLPSISLLSLEGGRFAKDEVDAIQPPPACFACTRCHRVKSFSRVKKDMWNEIVTWLSGGLLYGSEVPKPDWWTLDRKRAYAPRPNAAPATTRPLVAERLLKGWSYKKIAADLGIHWHTVDCHAQTIYRQHRVHSRAEFQRAMGIEPPPTKGELIRRRLEAGQSQKLIAAEMGIGRNEVSAHAGAIRRRAANLPKTAQLEHVEASL